MIFKIYLQHNMALDGLTPISQTPDRYIEMCSVAVLLAQNRIQRCPPTGMKILTVDLKNNQKKAKTGPIDECFKKYEGLRTWETNTNRVR